MDNRWNKQLTSRRQMVALPRECTKSMAQACQLLTWHLIFKYTTNAGITNREIIESPHVKTEAPYEPSLKASVFYLFFLAGIFCSWLCPCHEDLCIQREIPVEWCVAIISIFHRIRDQRKPRNIWLPYFPIKYEKHLRTY